MRGLPAVMALGLLLGPGAAAAAPAPFVAGDAPAAGRPRVAVLPLENFSGRAEVGETVTRVLFTELARTGTCEPVELGEVERAVEELRVRNTGSLSSEAARGLGERLSAPYLLIGSVLECGTVRTPDGDVPSAAVALRLLEARSNRVLWADLMARTGEDRETVFGWGREHSPTKLVQELVGAMLRRLPKLGAAAHEEAAPARRQDAGPEDKSPAPDGQAPAAEKPVGEPPTGGNP